MHQPLRGSGYIIAALVFLFVVCYGLESECDFPVWTNGCSVPMNLPFFYKKKFTTACNHHDVCYHCGYTFGIARQTCDEIFLENMRQQCTRSHIAVCKSFGALYYGVVRKMASSHYLNQIIPQCLSLHVLPCLT